MTMNACLLIAFLFFITWLTPQASAQNKPLPEGGEPLIADAATEPLPFGIRVVGKAPDVQVTAANFADGPGGKPGRGVKVVTTTVPDSPWNQQLVSLLTTRIEKGQTGAVELYVRGKSELGAEATVGVVFERNGPPHTKSVDQTVTVGPDQWTRLVLPFSSREAYDADGALVGIRLGYGAQWLDVANVRVLKFPDGVSPKDLPRTAIKYAGMEPDSAWRADAARRIDELRKAELTVTVVDRAGKPQAGRDVHIQMTRHAFAFGTAVEHDQIFADTPDGQKYREILSTWFNYATGENELKWPVFEKKGSERAIETLDWLRDHNMQARGHNLLWPGWQSYFLPDRVQEGYEQRAAENPEHAREWLAEQMRQHLIAKALLTRGRVVGWDVANEVANLRKLMEILGDTDDSDAVLTEWFKLLREVDPNAEAYLNDYGIMVGNGLQTKVRERYLQQAQYLIDHGQTPDAIGVQCHFGSNLTGPERAWALLDEVGALGIPIEVTEFDVTSGDEDLNGQFARDFMTVCFAHERVRAFILWGFWEGRHWRGDAAMFRRDWTLRPAGQAWKDLVLGEWWTDETLATGADGVAKLRAFKGDYTLTVGNQEIRTTLPDEGRNVLIEVD